VRPLYLRFSCKQSTYHLTFPPAGRPKAGGGESGICNSGTRQDHPAVKKPDGSWRCSSHYCQLNNVTVPDTYWLPNMMDFSSRVAECSSFSKIDI
jgi:hypothetical protein